MILEQIDYVFGTDPFTAINGRTPTERTAKMLSCTRPVNSVRQAAYGTGRHAIDGTRHTCKNGDAKVGVGSPPEVIMLRLRGDSPAIR
ncbi:hypothetical protein B0H11DRAFT_2234116 [Mycena galericulata]|nr:hypothetical protein B0H11DRAFT_2234116 [Mycena galericulata]